MKEARPFGRPQPDAPDERELVEKLISRDQAALSSLYDRYGRVVYAVALKIMGNPSEAEDVVIDTFWQIWQQAARFDLARGSFGAWLFTIARSRALDRLRALRHSPLAAADEPHDAALAREAGAADNPEQDLWLAERSALVRAALGELSPAQREAIELAYYRGLSHSEIASRLGEPLGTVKTRIRLGLAKLREKIGERL